MLGIFCTRQVSTNHKFMTKRIPDLCQGICFVRLVGMKWCFGMLLVSVGVVVLKTLVFKLVLKVGLKISELTEVRYSRQILWLLLGSVIVNCVEWWNIVMRTPCVCCFFNFLCRR